MGWFGNDNEDDEDDSQNEKSSENESKIRMLCEFCDGEVEHFNFKIIPDSDGDDWHVVSCPLCDKILKIKTP